MTEQKKLSKDGSPHVTNEVFNTVSHLAGAIFSLLGAAVLIVFSVQQGDIWKIVSFSVYGLSLITLFTFSAFHHGINASKRWEDFFRLFDYNAIFMLIAGTFTPLCLVTGRTIWGWTIFGVIWALAGGGIAIKSVFPGIPKWVTSTIYVCMGWIGGLLVVMILPAIGWGGLLLVLSGGLAYSAGAVIFYREKPNPVPGVFGFHEIWHLFVLLGAVIHYAVMWFIILPF